MRALVLALTLTISTTGCSKQDQETNNASASKRESSAAGSSTPGTYGPGGHAAADKATETEQALGEAKLEATVARQEANAASAESNKLTTERLQREFDAADRRFNLLKQKAANATGAMKKNADASAAEVAKREATMMASIAKLRDATGAQWDATKTQADADAVALNKAIDAFEATLQ